MQGEIRKYIPARGFGFIRLAGRLNDVFFHVRNVLDYTQDYEPAEGQRVEFEIMDTDKGPAAYHVVRAERNDQ